MTGASEPEDEVPPPGERGASDASLFISHSSRDAEAARAIVSALEREGIPCWIAPRDIPAGSEYNGAIMDGIAAARALVLLHSRHAAASRRVLQEVHQADAHGTTVIPVRLDPTPSPPALSLLVSTFQWVDAFPPPIDRHFAKIADGLRRALDPAHVPARKELPADPEFIGPYRLLGRLGEGGMGVVYRAEQRTPVRRTVAVKLIRGSGDSDEVVARFESERQALARMNHPHIASAIEAGADDRGRPYFVMEYVPGRPITEFADENKLSIAQRLELFMQVCDAIAHAHTKGIVHRDIKASNVLAYHDGETSIAKVIDFGVAKALTNDRLTDRTFHTERGQVVGTYDSMSPEQAAGSPDIDTRTDVYSLGVLLYELLAGARPFARETLAQAADLEIRRIIREVEPPRPSTRLLAQGALAADVARARRVQPDALVRTLRAELEWVPMMAMRKERDRRYASPLELAEDLRRYLGDLPLKAGPESIAYRARKTLRRHRAAFFSGAVAVTATIAGTVLHVRELTAEQLRTSRALTQVQEEQVRTRDALELARRHFEEKRRALDEMLADFTDERLALEPGTQPVRRRLLLAGMQQYEGMLEGPGAGPDVALRASAGYRELGAVVSELDPGEAAFAHFERSVELARRAVAESPTVEARQALGDALYDWGQACVARHRDRIAALAGESAAIYESLIDEHPQDATILAGLGRAIVLSAYTRDEVKADDTRAIELLRTAAERAPSARTLAELGRAINARTVLAGDAIDAAAALEDFLEAAELETRALELNPALSVATTWHARFIRNAAYDLVRAGRAPEALDLVEAALETARRFAEDNPAVLSARFAVADLLNERADVLPYLDRIDDAVTARREEATRWGSISLLAPHDVRPVVNWLDASLSVASLLEVSTRVVEAIAALRVVVDSASRWMADHPASDDVLERLLRGHAGLGRMYLEVQRFDEARAAMSAGADLFAAAAEGVSELSEASRVSYVRCCDGLLAIARDTDRPHDGLAVGERLVDDLTLDDFSSTDSKQALLGAWVTLGNLYEAIGDMRRSLDLTVRVRDEARRAIGGRPESDWYVYQRLFGSHQHIVRKARAVGDAALEYEGLCDYFGETRPYTYEEDHSELLERTSVFSEESLATLRESFDGEHERGGMKRFTVPVDFSGVKYPFHVYVAESWPFLADQFAWVETVRGGDVSEEVVASFRRLYDIARENGVSFQELCVYALGAAHPSGAASDELLDESSPLTRDQRAAAHADASLEHGVLLARELRSARARLEASDGDPLEWKQLAVRYLRLAEKDIRLGNQLRVEHFLEEAREVLAARPATEPAEEDLDEYYSTLVACYDAVRGELTLSHAALLESITRHPGPWASDFAFAPGTREYALGWVASRLDRPLEAAAWYRRALELGHGHAAQALYLAWSRNSLVAEVVDQATRAALVQARDVSTSEKPGQLRFAEIIAAQEQLDAALQRLAAAEEAFAADPSPVHRSGLASALITAADRALYVRRWVDAERYGRRAAALDIERTNPYAWGNTATSLLYRGLYDEAREILTTWWTRPLDRSDGKSFAGLTYADFDLLESAGITHPDVARLKAALPLPHE